MGHALGYWLWPVVINVIGDRNAASLLFFLATFADLVEGDPGETDGQGKEKKKAVTNAIIIWLTEKGLWSTYWLHVHFWTTILSHVVDRVVAILKENEWKNVFEFEGADDAEDPAFKAAMKSLAPALNQPTG